ncbi:YgiQ family radical SAM protein [Fusibacillus kribbianus]|uniref:YgiQ family radical SAM protein n=1 Tax=Fusibacillus kribbianus TaxID=3044208 RepID=A0AAP4BCS5_9FIRM|nr:YgiQ family radical SAM protein [Ruminococcus sp. YH-rum2234]MDI9243247.1 YgiQ family radical SAM protein [Ruminococcus sp. YH-rum2234]
MREFLPVCQADMKKRGWDQLDFVYIIGDAYVDHPSFGPAIISRLLESRGYRVGIISQPDWKDEGSIQILGKPRLAFLVSSGNMDSMVNHYSVSKRRRETDSYTPGGVMGKRPDYAVVVYCNLIRRIYKQVPIVIGGIEASLRRLAHYDYWSNQVKRSVLMDSQADLLSYGMGEHSILEIAEALAAGIPVSEITYVAGTAFRTKTLDRVYDAELLPDYETVKADKQAYAESFRTQYRNTDPIRGRRLAEGYGTRGYVVQNPPAMPLSTEEMDEVYDLPYMRTWHPMYDEAGGIPAFSEVKFSLVSNRGCFGSCSFCALTFHQGRIVQVRSHESIEREARLLTKEADFKGYIHDVGGPTADFRSPSCDKQLKAGTCPDRQCLFPSPCKNLKADHKDYLILLRKLRSIPGVKKVFIRSGIRFDYVLADPDGTFLKELCEYHVSGQLKVAPEHISPNVLKYMGKPDSRVYLTFAEKYKRMNERLGKKQYLVPYLMSSHPGCTIKDAVILAEYLRDIGHMPEQVQDFYPTPSTLSTCMYYTGVDPRTMEKVYVPKSPHEKAMQRALIQYKLPGNRALVEEALKLAGRTDLIGYGYKCLIRPERDNRSEGREAGKAKNFEEGRRTRKKPTIRNVHKKKKGKEALLWN